jgi:hypothetical protein
MIFKPMSLVAVYRSISGRIRRYPLRGDDHAPRIMHWHGDTFHLDTIEQEPPMTYATTTAQTLDELRHTRERLVLRMESIEEDWRLHRGMLQQLNDDIHRLMLGTPLEDASTEAPAEG